MQTIDIRHNKTSHYCIISASLILLLLFAPLSAFAQDTNSIATLRQMGNAFAQIAERASPAVVTIKAEKTITLDYYSIPDWPFGEGFSPFDDNFFDYFFRGRPSPRHSPKRQQKSVQTAQASGFIISPDGYILTNNHLVGGADKVLVRVVGHEEAEAKVVGTDAGTDVAVVKIDGDDLPYLKLADSDKLQVGEWVIAIGNPFGLSHTVTAGIVSAKGRSIFNPEELEYQDFIQTDAAINRGNSGGPLINLNGKVVGINTAIIAPGGGNIGIGMAIPINLAKHVQQQLIDTGKVALGYLGIYMSELTAELAEGLGLDADTKGVAVSQVIEDSPAEKAGLKHNDVIIEFEGEPVEDTGEFRNRVAMLKPGTKAKLLVLRDGKRKSFTIEVGERPSADKIAEAKSQTIKNLGLTVQNLTDDLAERFGYEDLTGVVVTGVEAGSQARRKGITTGMLIMEINREPVANTKEFDTAVKKVGKGGSILLLITDGQIARYVVLKLPKE